MSAFVQNDNNHWMKGGEAFKVIIQRISRMVEAKANSYGRVYMGRYVYLYLYLYLYLLPSYLLSHTTHSIYLSISLLLFIIRMGSTPCHEQKQTYVESKAICIYKDMELRGSDEGDAKNSTFALKRFWEEEVLPELDLLLAQQLTHLHPGKKRLYF